MDEKIKAAHAMLEASESHGVFYWKCTCGAAGGGDVSPGAAVDGHAEHVQEAGEYSLDIGFEVAEAMHGPECVGCQKSASRAARRARKHGLQECRGQVLTENVDPWEDPEVEHWAVIRRPEV